MADIMLRKGILLPMTGERRVLEEGTVVIEGGWEEGRSHSIRCKKASHGPFA